LAITSVEKSNEQQIKNASRIVGRGLRVGGRAVTKNLPKARTWTNV
jgi:hypothetical protein